LVEAPTAITSGTFAVELIESGLGLPLASWPELPAETVTTSRRDGGSGSPRLPPPR
jgi:hypothetical protein